MNVVQEWASELPFRMQTVMLSALRGCDGIPKEDVSKKITRKFRGCLLRSAHKDISPKSFMHDGLEDGDLATFFKGMDHYPTHWLFHLLHATEIMGYYHPIQEVSGFWRWFYLTAVDSLHLMPESKSDLENRLGRGTAE